MGRRTGHHWCRVRRNETVDRRPNGYRTYPPEAVLVLEPITTAQQAGFSLDGIRRLLPAGLDQWDHAALTEALRRKVADIDASA